MREVEEQLVQRSSAQKRQRLEAEVDTLLGNETSSQVGPGQERIVQQGEQQRDAQAQPPISSAAAASRPQRGGLLQRGGVMQRQLRLTDMNIAQRPERANTQLSMLFYGCGIPFNVARSPLFKRAMQTVAECGPG